MIEVHEKDSKFILRFRFHAELKFLSPMLQSAGSFMMHEKAVIAVAFNKDSELLASGSQDGQIKVWRVATGQCVRRYEKAHSEGVTCITWSKDSTQLLTGRMSVLGKTPNFKTILSKTISSYH